MVSNGAEEGVLLQRSRETGQRAMGEEGKEASPGQREAEEGDVEPRVAGVGEAAGHGLDVWPEPTGEAGAGNSVWG